MTNERGQGGSVTAGHRGVVEYAAAQGIPRAKFLEAHDALGAGDENPNIISEQAPIRSVPRRAARFPLPLDRHHRIRVDEQRIPIRLRLLRQGQAMAQRGCRVTGLGGFSHRAQSDGDGVLRLWIPQGLASVRITLDDGGGVFEIQLGALAPLRTPRGLRQRLNHLGASLTLHDGPPGEVEQEAWEALCRRRGMAESMVWPMNEAGWAQLRGWHGC